MKRVLPLLFFALLTLIGLQDCKRENVNKKVTTADPDSLYAGTKYSMPANLFRFPQLNNPYADSMTYEGVALGRRLFYDKHLSQDNSKSCASCHNLQTAFSDSGRTLSINEFGLTKRNSPALQNLAWAPYLFWDGRAGTLAAQAQNAFHNELGIMVTNAITYIQTDSTDVRLFKKAFGRPGTVTEAGIYKAIQQFLMTAISANSRFDNYLQTFSGFSQSELNGYRIFNSETGDCFHCHMSNGGQTLLLTDNLFHNNGLDSALTNSDFSDAGRGAITLSVNDTGKFKVPSLRNIALTPPYMHDGRYKTLAQVVNFYSDSTHLSPTVDPIMLYPTHNFGAGLHLSQSDKNDLVNFLYTLTDTSFLHNPNLTNPF